MVFSQNKGSNLCQNEVLFSIWFPIFSQFKNDCHNFKSYAQFAPNWVCRPPLVHTIILKWSPPVLNIWPCKNNSHIQVLVIYFFATPPMKLKLQIGGRLLRANHLDQSLLWLTNQKQGTVVRSYLVTLGVCNKSSPCLLLG
jgi:hypothetical protein